jgi:two-component system cell cycle response regulator DivK
MPDSLYWSHSGAVACHDHAPSRGSARWADEQWQAIPAEAQSYHMRFRCPECLGTGAVAGAAAAAPDGPKRLTILNVDDRSVNLYVRHRILRAHGFDVVNVRTGEEAGQLAHRLRPDLILLDIYLPDVDGRELCQRFKADPLLARIPVVFISTQLRSPEEQLEAVQGAGADGCIGDPFDDDAFVVSLRATIAASGAK